MNTYIFRIGDLVIVVLHTDEAAATLRALEIALHSLNPGDDVTIKSVTTLNAAGHCSVFCVGRKS